jgi:hypothetical protein
LACNDYGKLASTTALNKFAGKLDARRLRGNSYTKRIFKPGGTMESTKQPWKPMKLTYVGHVAEIVKGGRGKLSRVGGDPGEIRKDTESETGS